MQDSGDKHWLVIATEGELGRENRCFMSDVGRGIPGGGLFSALAEQARARGWTPMTLDVAEAAFGCGGPPREIHLISDMGCGMKSQVARHASHRSLYCLESPLQSKAFHLRLARLSKEFDRACLFGGLVPFSRAAQTLATHFPVSDRRVPSGLPAIADRRFMVAICGRKSAFAWNFRSEFGMIRAAARDAVYLVLRQMHPILRAPDYYTVRRRVIEKLAATKRITVYGTGWENTEVANVGAWAGSVSYSEKLATLARYRFCLCFENCGFPGYVTEKIYDCFLAGTIPIYLGAPDIAVRVPKAAYIAYRELGTPERLVAHLDGLSIDQLRELQTAGAAVLESDEFTRTAPGHMARQILG